MQDGFVKVAAYTPKLRVADCGYNIRQLLQAATAAAENGVKILVTPELGITGSTCGDLFLQDSLLNDAETALMDLCSKTAALPLIITTGIPFRHFGKLYNCAAVICRGHLLGIVPKSFLSDSGGFCETRHFTPAFAGIEQTNGGLLRKTPIGASLLFRCAEMPSLTIGIELGGDLWAPIPPSVLHASAGAGVILNLSASEETAGKQKWRREIISVQAKRLACAYVYANAGNGESCTDHVFSGHSIIAENGNILAESAAFSGESTVTEVDVGRLEHERRRLSALPSLGGGGYLFVGFSLPVEETAITRTISDTPFIPKDESLLARRCGEILDIQAAALRRRMEHTGCQKIVIGISGGLDSSLALLVCARALAAANRPVSDILAVIMPGFGTTDRTRSNAEKLIAALGATVSVIDICDTTRAHFKDICQSGAKHDITYENAQARIRTLTLMDLANQQNGLVVGTGDLSESALGWSTYNGDHMSMYNPNTNIPKTLIYHLIAYEAGARPKLRDVLRDILDTPISPELLPPKNGEISQETEQIIGPYILHDFFLYYTLRWGFTPKKTLRLACIAFKGRYGRDAITHCMQIFYRRFFSQQFKRNCMPEGPKVGNITLSPRGGWQMPSDAAADGWLREAEKL